MSGPSGSGAQHAGSCDFVSSTSFPFPFPSVSASASASRISHLASRTTWTFLILTKVRKLVQILDDVELSHIVQWEHHGNSFTIHDVDQFSRVALETYFSHHNFSSFVRQLNKYDFHKVRRDLDDKSPDYNPDACEYSHTCFRRGRRDLLGRIKRKQPASRRQRADQDDGNLAQQVHTLNDQMAALHERIDQIDRLSATLATILEETVRLAVSLCDEVQTLKSTRQPAFPSDVSFGIMPLSSHSPQNNVPQELSAEQLDHWLSQCDFSVPPTYEVGDWVNAGVEQQDDY